MAEVEQDVAQSSSVFGESFTARRSTASNLPTFQLPPPDHLSQYKYPAYAPSTSQPTPAVVNNVLTPPPGLQSDLSPLGGSVNSQSSGSSAAGVPPYQPMGHWPTHSNNSYTYNQAQQQAQQQNQQRPAPQQNQPPQHKQQLNHNNIISQQAVSQAPPQGPLHAPNNYGQRPPPTPTNYYTSSSTPQQSSFPANTQQSPTQQSPNATSAPSNRISPVSAQPYPSIAAPQRYPRPSFSGYSLPAMTGPVMSNVHSPGAQMALVGGMNMPYPMGLQMYSHHPYQQQRNDRPFMCDQCPQSFNRNHDLKRHKLIHLAVKPFPCGHCEKSFSRKDALKRHVLVKNCGKIGSGAAKVGGGQSPVDKADIMSDSAEGGSPDDTDAKTCVSNSAFDIRPDKEDVQTVREDTSSNLFNYCHPKRAPGSPFPEVSTVEKLPSDPSDSDGQLSTAFKEEVLLETLAPKRGWLEEIMLSLSPRMIINHHPQSHLLLRLQNWWAKSRRNPVAEGYTRVEWKCPCGHNLFADFKTKSPELIAKYVAVLKQAPSTASQSTASQASTLVVDSPPIVHLHHQKSSNILTQTPQGSGYASPASTLQTCGGIANGNSNLSFLELCVNTGPHLKSLAEIDTTNISTDGELFRTVRKQYLRLRRFRSKFWLLKPAAVSFVRFSLEDRHRVGILQKPLALPPKSEVDAKKWIYDPCPLEGDPPIAEDLFLHYLQCSEGLNKLFWMLRFPRKLETSLLKSTATAAFGWGVYIDEGPNYAALFKANFIVLVLSGIAAGLWKLFEKDFQGAFGFACWIIAVLNSLLMAYMFKWRQE